MKKIYTILLTLSLCSFGFSQVPTFNPTDGATGVSVSPTLTMSFSGYSSLSLATNSSVIVRNVTTSTSEITLSTGNGLDPADTRLQISGNTLTIDLTGDFLVNGNDYAIYVPDGTITVDSSPYDELDNLTTWNFTIASGVADPTFSPADNATDISLSPTLTMTFDSYSSVSLTLNRTILVRNVTTSTTTFSLSTGNGLDPMDSRLSISGNALTIDLSGETLDASTDYAIFTTDGTIDVDGEYYNELNDLTKWNFTTTDLTVSDPTFSPLDDATGVSISPSLSMTFDGYSNASLNTNGSILIRNVTTSTTEITLSTGNGLDPMDSRINISGNVITIDLTGETLTTNNEYAVFIADDIIEADGLAYNELANVTKWSFTTENLTVTDPTLSPLDDAIDISLSPTLSMTFDAHSSVSLNTNNNILVRNVTTSTTEFSLTTGNGLDPMDSRLSISGNALTIDLSGEILNSNNDYAIYIPDETIVVDGLAYDKLQNLTTWNFTTIDNTIADPTFSPADNATGVSITPVLTATFEEGTTVSLANGQVVVIRNKTAGSNIYSFTIGTDSQVSTNGNILTIDLSENTLVGEVEYAVYIIDDVISVDGQYYNQLENYDNWSFTTDKFYTWTGNSDTDFGTTANWSGTDTYTDGFSVIIPQIVSGNLPTIANGSTSNIKNMIIEAGGSLDIESGGTLNITNTITLESSVEPSVGNANLIVNGTIETTGASVNVQQEVGGGTVGAKEGMYVATPVSGPTMESSNIAHSLYLRDAQNASWQQLTSTQAMVVGTGYIAYGNTGDKFNFSGSLNNDAVGPLTMYRTSSPNNYGWNLIGNPFPCSIDWQYLDDNGHIVNLDEEFYIYNDDVETYGVYNSAGSEPLYVNCDTNNPSHIPSCHSFWVQVDFNQSSGSITIPKEARVNTHYSYLKSSNTNSTIQQVRFSGINSSGTQDELLISFSEDANDDFDNLDSEKRFVNKASILQPYTTHSSGKNLVIDTYNNYEGGKAINLGYKVGESGTFKFKLSDLKNINEDVIIKLEDIQNETIQTISEGDEYEFYTEAGTFNDRFVVHLLPGITTDSKSNNFENSIRIYAVKKNIYINLPEVGESYYQIYTTSGKLVQSGQLQPSTINNIQIQQKGIIIVRVTSNEQTFNQKLLIRE